jgi:hypothetical protein
MRRKGKSRMLKGRGILLKLRLRGILMMRLRNE